MEYEIRLYKFHNGTGQWEIWQCIDGEWEEMYEEAYKFIDDEDSANQYFNAVLGMRRLEETHV